MPVTTAFALFVVIVTVPGLLVGLAAGVRGWTLAATVPLISYGVFAVAGTVTTVLGLPWTVWTIIVATALLAGLVVLVAAAMRRFAPGLGTGEPETPPWAGRSHLMVIGATVLACGFGVVLLSQATADLTGIPQGWDANFHGNVVRYIAEFNTADPNALRWIHYYEEQGAFYYPNGFHLPAAIVYSLSGATVATALNVGTALIAPIFTLGIVGLLRRFRVRASLAAAAALLSISIQAMPYDLIWRGPLLPNALGLALVPAFMILLHVALSKHSLAATVLVPMGAAALVVIHPSNAFVAAVFAVAFVAERWIGDRTRIRREAGLLAIAAVGAAVLALPSFLGSLGSAAGDPLVHWDADQKPGHALADVITFSHGSPFPRVWLTLAFVIGAYHVKQLRAHWWLLGASGVFVGLFVLTSGYSADWVAVVTRPWWNDNWRLLACATPGLLLVAAHGIVVSADWLRSGSAWLAAARPRLPLVGLTRRVLNTGPTAPVLVMVAFALLSSGMYYSTDASRVSRFYYDTYAVSPAEVSAYHRLGDLVPDGAMVMNQGTDGSPWMYAVAGVRPVFGHADRVKLGPHQKLLKKHFNEIDSNQRVQRVVRSMNIQYAIVGSGYVGDIDDTDEGLKDLDEVDALQEVFRNSDATVYRVLLTTTPTGNDAASMATGNP